MKRIEYKWVVAITFVLGLFMEIMDTTIVNVAIPTLRKDFNASTAGIEWIVLGYLLALAVFIPASGWIGDRIGTKKTFLFALFTFTTASALCGLSSNLSQLIIFRFVQGIGGGMLTPVGTAMLYRAFPPEERARASTVLIGPTVLAPALGPVIGGAIVDNLSWRWMFYVNLPIGIAGFVFGFLFLKEHKEPTAGRFDLPGFLLSGCGLAGILYALSQAPEHGWTSTPVLLTGIGGLALMAAMVKVETTVAEPMLALRLYKDRIFRNANFVNSLTYGSFMGFLFLLPQMLQGSFGVSAMRTGLTTLPQAMGVILMSRVSGRLYHTIGPRRLITGGLIGAGIFTMAFTFIEPGASLWWVRLFMFLRGCSIAYAFVPLQASTYSNIGPRDTGRASAIFSTQRQSSAALGVAVLATIFISRTNGAAKGMPMPNALVSGYHHAYFFAALLAFVAAITAYSIIRDADAAATMRPRQRA